MTRAAAIVQRFGNEQEPVIIIDNFCGELDRLVAAGLSAEYQAVMGYPGVRAPADVRYLSPHGDVLADLLYETFGFSVGFRVQSCSYSIVSTPPEALAANQRIPHYDDTGPDLLAFLHYTGAPDTGGTAFYRHRRTGYETVTLKRQDAYRLALREDDRLFGAPSPGYCYGDTERYEMIGEVDARPDRMVIYRGRTLHSGIIPDDLPLVADPKRGRLTVNTFATGVS